MAGCGCGYGSHSAGFDVRERFGCRVGRNQTMSRRAVSTLYALAAAHGHVARACTDLILAAMHMIDHQGAQPNFNV